MDRLAVVDYFKNMKKERRLQASYMSFCLYWFYLDRFGSCRQPGLGFLRVSLRGRHVLQMLICVIKRYFEVQFYRFVSI